MATTPNEVAIATEWRKKKTACMEELLGPMHNIVSHALLPFSMGGALDLYYFPNGRPGTAIATMELSRLPKKGPSNNCFQSYELVMFTREHLAMDEIGNDESPFGRTHGSISSVLNLIAPNCGRSKFNPGNTAEAPADDPDYAHIAGKCFIFDALSRKPGRSRAEFGLLAVIEIFRSEMKFVAEFSGASLITWLQEAGHYPYSDLNRKPLA